MAAAIGNGASSNFACGEKSSFPIAQIVIVEVDTKKRFGTDNAALMISPDQKPWATNVDLLLKFSLSWW